MNRLRQSLAKQLRPSSTFRKICDSLSARPGSLLPSTPKLARREISTVMSTALSKPEYLRPGMTFQPHYTDLQLDRAAILRYCLCGRRPEQQHLAFVKREAFTRSSLGSKRKDRRKLSSPASTSMPGPQSLHALQGGQYSKF